MPLLNFHSGRVRDPDDFLKDKEYWATITLKNSNEVELVTGKLKSDGPSGPMTAQAYRFPKDKFTEKQAKEWLKKHKVKTILFEPAKKEVKEEMKIMPNFEDIWAKITGKKTQVTEQQVKATSDGDGYLFKGSYEETTAKIRDALKKSKDYGDWPMILATFPGKVFVEAYISSADKMGLQAEGRKFWEVEYTIDGDEIKLGTSTELEKKTTLLVKEWGEDIASKLFRIDETVLLEKEWDTAFINDLPDKCFAYIAPGGKKDDEGKTKPRSLRHLPYRDASGEIDKPHLRNALARLPQTKLSDEAKKKAKKVLDKAAEEAEVGEGKKD